MNSKKTKRSSESGFSLMDILASIIILSIALMALSGGLLYAVGLANAASAESRAQWIIDATLNDIRNGSEKRGYVFSTFQYVSQGGRYHAGRRKMLENSGADSLSGTTDDSGNEIAGYEREIIFTDQTDARVRKIEVIVYFSDKGTFKSRKTIGYLVDKGGSNTAGN